MSVERIMQDVVEQTLRDIQTDFTIVDEILWNLDPERVEDFKSFLANNEILIQQGWSGVPTQLPSICFTVDTEEEAEPSLGLSGIGDAAAADWRDVYQVLMEGTYVALVISFNGDITANLARLVKWAFIRHRNSMQIDHGLIHQKVGMKAFVPKEGYQASVVFGRAVTLSAGSYEAFSITTRDSVPTAIDIGTIITKISGHDQPIYP